MYLTVLVLHKVTIDFIKKTNTFTQGVENVDGLLGCFNKNAFVKNYNCISLIGSSLVFLRFRRDKVARTLVQRRGLKRKMQPSSPCGWIVNFGASRTSSSYG